MSGHGTHGDNWTMARYSSDVRSCPVVVLIGEKNASPVVVAEVVAALEEVEVVGVFELSSLFGEEDLEGLRRRRSGEPPPSLLFEAGVEADANDLLYKESDCCCLNCIPPCCGFIGRRRVATEEDDERLDEDNS